MKRIDMFNECCRGGYNNTDDYVSWKIIDNIMYFQCSRERDDWRKNIDIRLVDSDIGRTHKGFHDAYKSVYRVIMQNPVREYCGYSHGAVIAARAGAERGRPATVFGCPNFMFKPSPKILDSFWNVDFVENDNDIVARGLFWLKKGRNVILTLGNANLSGVPLLERLSHHGPSEYRQRLSVGW